VDAVEGLCVAGQGAPRQLLTLVAGDPRVADLLEVGTPDDLAAARVEVANLVLARRFLLI
jgi:hypothetical protein